MLRTLLTKEIKVFQSPIPSRPSLHGCRHLRTKKRDNFSAGYFGCRALGDPIISTKIAIFGFLQTLQVYQCAPLVLKYPRIFVFASYDWYSTCSVKDIANFAGFCLNADRKK